MLAKLKALIPQRSPIRLLWHKAKGFLAALKCGFPASKLRIIAVTGTDGKTTTVAMIAHILRSAGKNVGAVSTTFFRINDEIHLNETHKTSLPPFELQRFLRKCVEKNLEFAVVEVSSHGLVQGRLGPMQPEVAAITNTSLEHLDYHETMEQYRKDKGILFEMLRGKGTKVLNADDETFRMYSEIPSEKTMTYSANGNTEATLYLSESRATQNGSQATLHTNLQPDFAEASPGRPATFNFQLSVPGLFNLENALCALSCGAAAGISVESAVQALKIFQAVPGRLERIDEGQSFSVFVDFTVTPLAYEKTLQAIRAMSPNGRILVLTSSCGDRMPEKRPVIGKICSDLADVVVVTVDETITEDPLKVIEEIWAGVDQSKVKAQKISDRREAIAYLLKEAKPGDSVVLCGMGACNTMQTREGLIPWDEREVAREILKTLQQKPLSRVV